MKYQPKYRTTVANEREFYTAQEIARKLGVNICTVRKRAKEGVIPMKLVGRKYLIEKKKYDEWKETL